MSMDGEYVRDKWLDWLRYRRFLSGKTHIQCYKRRCPCRGIGRMVGRMLVSLGYDPFEAPMSAWNEVAQQFSLPDN